MPTTATVQDQPSEEGTGGRVFVPNAEAAERFNQRLRDKEKRRRERVRNDPERLEAKRASRRKYNRQRRLDRAAAKLAPPTERVPYVVRWIDEDLT
jgi:hypothetical protein